jgi:phenylacetate-CoA ligase
MMGHAGILPGERILFAHALGVYATSAILPPLRAAGYIPIDVDVRGGADSVIQFAELTKPVAMMTTPSLAQFLIDRMRDRTGREVRSLKLRAIFVVGEIGVGIPEIKKKIEDAYGCRVYDWIAPVGQTLAFSCDSEQYHGMHAVTPDTDLYPMDLVDPASRKRVEPVNGAEGEAVYTSLSRKALPVLRFGSGDLVRIETNECPCCGFKGNRVRVVGRADDMLIVKGTNVYPAAIRTVINEFIPAVSGQMRIVLNAPPPRVEPPLVVKIERGEGTDKNDLEALASRIKKELNARIKVTPEIEWVEPGDLERAVTKTPMFEKRY